MSLKATSVYKFTLHISPLSTPATYLLKKSVASLGLDFVDFIPMVLFNMLFCPLYFL